MMFMVSLYLINKKKDTIGPFNIFGSFKANSKKDVV